MAVPPQSILVVNPVMPRPDRDSGSLRLHRLLLLLAGAGHDVTLIARFGLGDEPCALALEKAGIEVHRIDPERFAEGGFELNVALPTLDLDVLIADKRFDVAVLSTWDVATQYLPIVRRVSPLTKIVIDTVDVHWVREHRGAEIANDPVALRAAEETRLRESAIYARADALVAVTEPDADHLRAMAPEVPVHVVSNVHDPDPRGPAFAPRDGVVFVGAFSHPPNVDAALHLVHDVWPSVRTQLPDARLFLVGTAPPLEVQALAGDGITVTGWVPEVRPYLDAARVSVAPLRFGAGVKGKIGEALGAGLPVVTTSIGAEGMDLADGETALVADTASDLAAAIVRMHADAALWERVADAGHVHIGETLGSGVARRALDALLTSVAPQTFLAPAGLDVASATELLRGYFGAFADDDPVSLVVPGGEELFDVLIPAIGALGRDPEHIPDLNVLAVPAGAPLPRAMRRAGEWTAPPAVERPVPDVSLVVRAGDDAEACAAQIEALAAAGLPDDVEVLIVGEQAPAVEGASFVPIPDWLGRRAAIQRAAARARGEVVVVLEPLVLPQPGFLAPLVAAARAGVAFAAPVIDGAHGYRVHADGSLWPAADGASATAVAHDVLAARRETWLDVPAALTAREGHAEVQLAQWASERGGIAIADAAHATRLKTAPGSALICTRNRGDELPDCIELLVASGVAEVLIVDNGSTDGSDRIARDLAAQHPLTVRVVDEPKGGLSHARNTAAEHATHEILLYLDDDARPGPGWYERMTHALSRPGVVQAGGPVVALWPPSRDAAWPPPSREGLLSILDLGDADRAFGGAHNAYGANWAVRKEALLAAGGFDPDFGWGPDNHIGGEEVQVATLIERHGLGAARYVAGASAGHRIAESRVSDAFLVDRIMRAGLESPVRLVALEANPNDRLAMEAQHAGIGLLNRCPIVGELTLEAAFGAIRDAEQVSLDFRLDAAYALGVIAASTLLLGETMAEVGGLRLSVRPEHLRGKLGPVPELEAV